MTLKLKQYGSIPAHIQRKAWREISLLLANKAHFKKWKAIRRTKGLYRLRLSRTYRMVVAAQSLDNGVYEVMKHSIFDKKY